MPNGIPDEEPRPGLLRPDDPDTVYSVMDYEEKIKFKIPDRDNTWYENTLMTIAFLLIIANIINFIRSIL